MAITSSEIHNMSFAIARKGYDVDEVDVFLEHVAAEIDELNNQIEQLEAQLDENSLTGLDVPVKTSSPVQTSALAPIEQDGQADDDKDARIADLEKQAQELTEQLESKRADDSAISQVLINAQRMADDTVASAKEQSESIIQDAHDEAKRILDEAEGERQGVEDAIKKLEDDREDARGEYQDLLKDFISDATRKLAEIGGDASFARASAHARTSKSDSSTKLGQTALPLKNDAKSGAKGYTTPQSAGPIVAPATPVPSKVEKDLSGFGDTDDGFEFEDVD